MKDALRLQFRARRDAMGAAERRRMAAQIGGHLLELEPIRNAATVLFYASFGSEVETPPMMTAVRGLGKRIGLPRMEAKHLRIHEVDPTTALIANRFGIPEPGESTPVIDPDDVGVVVVPGLAFDLHGARLGYGGGYYDRLLSTEPHAFRVGLAYSFQVVPRLPATPSDVPMDAIATERGVHWLPKRHH